MTPGLSPRVRGNPSAIRLTVCGWRSIPARAGEPRVDGGLVLVVGVYPRACGGTVLDSSQPEYIEGLSPRVRGNRRQA